MFARDKRIGPYTYVYLVENIREGGRAKQRIIANLGRKEVVVAHGDLDRLQEIELAQDGKRFLLRTPTTGVAGKLFQAVGVALPPNVQELPLATPQPAA